MKTYDPSSVLISMHLPKSGGTSFTDVLKKWFWPGFHAHYYRHAQNKLPNRVNPIRKMLHRAGVAPLCVHGHFKDGAGGVFEYYPDASQFITVLRDPLELQLSMYFYHKKRLEKEGSLYWKGNKVDMEYDNIDEWVSERGSFMLLAFPFEINLENYQEIIHKHFIHIGVTEKLQESVNIMADKFEKKPLTVPVKNATIRKEEPSNLSIERFREKHKLEYAIYEYVKHLNINK